MNSSKNSKLEGRTGQINWEKERAIQDLQLQNAQAMKQQQERYKTDLDKQMATFQNIQQELNSQLNKLTFENQKLMASYNKAKKELGA